MTALEIAIALSTMSLVVSIGTLYMAYLAYDAAERAGAVGGETAVLSLINKARDRIGGINMKILDIMKGRNTHALPVNEKRYPVGMEAIYHEAVETFLNNYDLACIMYRTNKLDQERFRRQYGEEIKKLFEDGTPAYKDRLNPVSSPYEALRAVYNEWYT